MKRDFKDYIQDILSSLEEVERKPMLKTEKVFEKIAKAGKTVEYLHPHDAYEGELEERFEKI
jgi:hypothetical protein